MFEIDKMSNKELNQLRVELIFSFERFLVKRFFYIYELLRVKKIVQLNIGIQKSV